MVGGHGKGMATRMRAVAAPTTACASVLCFSFALSITTEQRPTNSTSWLPSRNHSASAAAAGQQSCLASCGRTYAASFPRLFGFCEVALLSLLYSVAAWWSVSLD